MVCQGPRSLWVSYCILPPTIFFASNSVVTESPSLVLVIEFQPCGIMLSLSMISWSPLDDDGQGIGGDEDRDHDHLYARVHQMERNWSKSNP